MTTEVTHLWRVIESALGQMPFPPTQSKFAERVGVARSAVSDWKLGKTTPTPESMRAIAVQLEPVLGPTALLMLIEAMNRDGGYLPAAPADDEVQLRAARKNTRRPPRGPKVQEAD